MRGLDHERGATAVMVAILLVALLGFAALVVDVGNGFWEKRMLQNGADAAALAAAQDLAAEEDPATAEETARDFADPNNRRGAFVEEFDLDSDDSTIRVRTRTGEQGAGGVLQSWLAGLIGHDDYFARAEAMANWQTAGPGSAFPVIISYCEWEDLVGDPDEPDFPTDLRTIYLLDPHDETGECTGPSGHQAPGGWGWLDPDEDGDCEASIDEFGWVDGDTGSASPGPANSTGCTQEFFDELVASDEPILLPIFEEDNDLNGNNHEFRVLGFAAFEIVGYRVRGEWSGGTNPCSNPDRCFEGRFHAFYALGDEPGGYEGGMDLGAREVYLIE